MSETYKLNISTFDDGQPEEFLSLLRNFKIAIDVTGMTTGSGWINYLSTMICVTSLREFKKKSLAEDSTANHLKHIT